MVYTRQTLTVKIKYIDKVINEQIFGETLLRRIVEYKLQGNAKTAEHETVAYTCEEKVGLC